MDIMAKRWKILSLSLFALTGALAINASVVQAEWVILEEVSVGKVVSVGKINLKGSLEGAYLLGESGNKLHCTSATGTGSASVLVGGELLLGNATLTFTKCIDEHFPKVCTVYSNGSESGTFMVSATLVASMSGEEVYFKGEGSKLTQINYSGAECPLNEAEEPVSGTVKLSVLNSLVLAKSHGLNLKGEGLKLGVANAELHMLAKTSLPSVGASVEGTEGKPFAVHLL
jgi:hypothetical protein